jgi:16S rRNA (cytidine1402-2'-O)-methyltransferase
VNVTGSLILVPNLLGAVPPANVLPERTIEIARSIRHWVVETPKVARAFLNTIGMPRPIVELSIAAFGQATEHSLLEQFLEPARAGQDVGVLSDAGCPGVADPGASLVAAAHRAGIRVLPLVGPSALLLALMASGMNGQQFAFHGYLPVKPEARANALRRLEQRSRAERRTQIFIETPYRNAAMLETMTRALDADTRVCVAADLTLETETIENRTASEWRTADLQRFERRPAIFLLQA